MKKWLKIAGAIFIAIIVSVLVNYLLVWTSLWDSDMWRTILNWVELLWVVVAVILIIKVVSEKKSDK